MSRGSEQVLTCIWCKGKSNSADPIFGAEQGAKLHWGLWMPTTDNASYIPIGDHCWYCRDVRKAEGEPWEIVPMGLSSSEVQARRSLLIEHIKSDHSCVKYLFLQKRLQTQRLLSELSERF